MLSEHACYSNYICEEWFLHRVERLITLCQCLDSVCLCLHAAFCNN
uniref:Uncharacterized protein n=1 Tax=Arundo donax TaxID=35708 RepID=A0A0A9DSR9_ARUDO